jgi:hypothetical protein
MSRTLFQPCLHRRYHKLTLCHRRSFIDFQVWDFPGQINFFETAYDSQEIFGEVGALIFVIDAQV